MRKRILVGVLLAGLAGAGAALADDDCHVPMDRWQSREAAQQAAEAKGWQIDRIRIDDGCYEVRGVDAEGVRFKAKLDPETLEMVEWERRDRSDRHDRRKRHEQPPPEPAAPASQDNAPGDDAPPPAVE